ncbi:MAG: hypothetical protein AB1746_06615 [Candidatus Zixiibacteriota bacterium]
MEKVQLLPGEYVDLEIIFGSRTYNGMITKSPVIYTNEHDSLTATKTHRIQLTANIYQITDTTYPINIMPRLLDISILQDDAEMAFKIRNLSHEGIKITIIDYPKEYLRVRLPFKINAHEEGLGFVSLTSLGRESRFRKSITIELNDRDKTRFTIPVYRGPNITVEYGQFPPLDFSPGQIIDDCQGIH